MNRGRSRKKKYITKFPVTELVKLQVLNHQMMRALEKHMQKEEEMLPPRQKRAEGSEAESPNKK